MRGRKTDTGARTVIAGHAFIQNVCRGTINSPSTLHLSYVSRLLSMSSLKQSEL
jgi:hypothetical protein